MSISFMSKSVGQLGHRGLGAHHALHLIKFLAQLGERLGLLDGQADGVAALGDGVHDGLANPPHGIGDETHAALRVEFSGGVQQAEVALVDEVGEGQAVALVFAGHLHDEAQVARRPIRAAPRCSRF